MNYVCTDCGGEYRSLVQYEAHCCDHARHPRLGAHMAQPYARGAKVPHPQIIRLALPEQHQITEVTIA